MNEMSFVNLTPHEIVVLPEKGGEIRIPVSETQARCKAERMEVAEVEVENVRIPITKVSLGKIENLPEPVEGTIYIVSLLVAQKASLEGRIEDILVPDSAVRDSEGRIVGCRTLARQ